MSTSESAPCGHSGDCSHTLPAVTRWWLPPCASHPLNWCCWPRGWHLRRAGLYNGLQVDRDGSQKSGWERRAPSRPKRKSQLKDLKPKQDLRSLTHLFHYYCRGLLKTKVTNLLSEKSKKESKTWLVIGASLRLHFPDTRCLVQTNAFYGSTMCLIVALFFTKEVNRVFTVIEIPKPSWSSLTSATFLIGPTPCVFFSKSCSWNCTDSF